MRIDKTSLLYHKGFNETVCVDNGVFALRAFGVIAVTKANVASPFVLVARKENYETKTI